MGKKYGRKKDLSITGGMARWYNKNTKKSRLPEMQRYAQEVSKHIETGAHVLEIAPGPGYLSIALAEMGEYYVTGMDISADFVDICKHNAAEAGVCNAEFIQGNASEMPFSDGSFDYIICSAAFKNFKEPVIALCEMFRVLKPNGTALIVDMNREATKADVDEELSRSGMKGFDKLFVGFSFRTFLKKNAYTENEFGEMIAQSGFPTYNIVKNGISLYVYCHK